MSALRPVLREKRTSVEQAARTAARAIAEIGERVVCRFRGALTRLWRPYGGMNRQISQALVGADLNRPARPERGALRGIERGLSHSARHGFYNTWLYC